MAVLEDPHDGAERRGDRQQVHDNRFQRQDHGTEKKEQHEHRRGHDVGERRGRVTRDEIDRVEVDRRESGDRDPGVRRRRERTDGTDELTRLVAVNVLLSDHVEHDDMLADRATDERLELRRQL